MTQRPRFLLIPYVCMLTILLPLASAIAQNVFLDNKGKVVRIEVTGKDVQDYTRTNLGSGFFIHKDGFLITALHVVGTPDDWANENGKIDRKIELAWLDPNGALTKETRVVVVYYDPVVDLALLRIPQVTPAVHIGDSQTVKEGDRVSAIGYPGGAQQPSLSSGFIQLAFDSAYGGFFRADLSVREGSSGGPLFNESGMVVGVVNAGLKYAQGQGFAIPINLASALVAKIIRSPSF